MLTILWLACVPPDVEVPVEGQQNAQTQETMAFGACPPALPDSCRMAVLEGDPSVPGKLFTSRLVVPEAFELPPHTHPMNERLTVLEGDISVRFGREARREGGHRFTAGDYYVTRKGEPHYVWSEGGATVQLTGIGPWKVEPAK